MENIDWASLLSSVPPEQIPQTMASWGLSPPSLDAIPPGTPGASPWEQQAAPQAPQMAPSMGGPTPIASSTTLGQSSAAQVPGSVSPLVGALRGMVAPNVPQPQRVSSPNAPRPTGHVQSGGLINLLQHLGMLRGAQMPTSYQLPSTLGAALGGR
jgi:hypothetical protein